MPGPIGLTVHLAGLTHSDAGAAYEQVNHQGTLRLAQAVYARGCRRFVYVSTRCVGPGCGAYGESKRRAEEALRGFAWESLLILRPAEVYGAGGAEGIDGLLRLAATRHVVPLLFGHPGVRFAPLHCDDFVRAGAAAIARPRPGVTVLELCGPESLSGAALAMRIARRHAALPVPVWLPAVGALGRASRALGLRLFSPDQLERLTGAKSAERPSDDPALDFELSRFPA